MLRKIIIFLFGNPEDIGFENFLVLVLCFVISIIGIAGTIIDLFLDVAIITVVLTLIPALIFAGIFTYGKIKERFIISKYTIVFLAFIIINLQWPLNYGSTGPILYLFLVIQSFIIILFEKWKKLFLTVIVFVNISILFLIEYYHPDIFGHYKNNSVRLINLYLGTLMDLSLSVILISIALRLYYKEMDKAELADKLKSSFLSNMSHEIRSPMNAIVGFSELLKDSGINNVQQKYIEIVTDNTYQLLKLIDDIIDISKIDANQISVSNEEFSVYELLNSVDLFIQQYLIKHGKQHLQLIVNNPPENLFIQSDYARIKQVLNNLLSNAIKFTETGNIVLGYSVGDGTITFNVSDTGIGIRNELLVEIFDRFRKIDNPSNEKLYRGTGLGLSISKQIIELLKGKIWAESELGKGSSFSFSITTPIVYKHFKTEVAPNNKDNTRFSGALILIAEDNDTNFEFLSEILRNHQLKFIRAINGKEAFELCKSIPEIKLVLMDMKMPVMNGHEATKLIKKRFPNMPVIAQSGYSSQTDVKECFKSGCDEYISKPINVAILFQKLNLFLNKV